MKIMQCNIECMTSYVFILFIFGGTQEHPCSANVKEDQNKTKRCVVDSSYERLSCTNELYSFLRSEFIFIAKKHFRAIHYTFIGYSTSTFVNFSTIHAVHFCRLSRATTILRLMWSEGLGFRGISIMRHLAWKK